MTHRNFVIWHEITWKIETEKERRARLRVAYTDLFIENERKRNEIYSREHSAPDQGMD